MQNFIQIGLAVSVLRMRDFALLGTKLLTEAPKGHREFFFAIISGSDIISDPEIIAKNFPDVPSALPCKARWYKVTRLFLGGS